MRRVVERSQLSSSRPQGPMTLQERKSMQIQSLEEPYQTWIEFINSRIHHYLDNEYPKTAGRERGTGELILEWRDSNFTTSAYNCFCHLRGQVSSCIQDQRLPSSLFLDSVQLQHDQRSCSNTVKLRQGAF